MRTRETSPPAAPGRTGTERAIGRLLIAFGAVAIAILTLRPAADRSPLPVFCLTCGDRPAVDVLLNILLFVPLGMGLALAGLRIGRAMSYAVCTTLVVESLQFVAITGRDASIRDVMSNSLGALAGYVVARHWKSLAYPSARLARRAFATGATLWIATQFATAWAMAPDLPRTPWWGQIKPQYDRYPAVFTGTVVALSVGSIPVLENDTIPGAAEARRELMRGASVRATVTNVERREGIAPVVIITAQPPGEVAMWALKGNNAVFAAAVRAARAGLRAPSVLLTGVMPAAASDTLTLTGSYAGGYYRLRSDDGVHVRTRVFAASPSLGWALVMPFPWYAFGEEVRIVTALWLAAVWVVLGYWAARASETRAGWGMFGAALATMGVGFLGAALAYRLPFVHWSEWIAVLLAFTFAVGAVRVAARSKTRESTRTER